MKMGTPKATPLVEEHKKLGAKMVEFAGWLMPVEYRGLRHEHLNTRAKVGLFDVSHMGEIRFQGPKSLESLQWLTSNDVSRLGGGQAQYSLLTNEKGGIVDDLIVYCVEPGQDYLVCVNAANIEKDFNWMQKHNKGAEIQDQSALWGQIAVQGPQAMRLVARLFGESVNKLKSFNFESLSWQGVDVFVARTGYTGEDGVEIFIADTHQDKNKDGEGQGHGTVALWQELLRQGLDLGVEPVGLGARDTLRTEMKYSLYGHEIDDTTNPYAAGLGWVVKPMDKDFLGKSAILEQKEKGLRQKLVGFKMLEKGGIPRSGYSLFSFDNVEIGKVTSGTVSPSLSENIGMAYVDLAFSEEGVRFEVEIRQRRWPAQVVKTPFVHVKRS